MVVYFSITIYTIVFNVFFVVLDSFAAIYIGPPLTAFVSLIPAAHFLSD